MAGMAERETERLTLAIMQLQRMTGWAPPECEKMLLSPLFDYWMELVVIREGARRDPNARIR